MAAIIDAVIDLRVAVEETRRCWTHARGFPLDHVLHATAGAGNRATGAGIWNS